MFNTTFYILIGIIIFEFIFSAMLKYLDLKKLNPNLPKELESIYDPEKYSKSQEYERVNTRFSYLTSSLNFIIIMLMFFFGGFALVHNFAVDLTTNPILIALIFFGILLFASELIGIPFEIYDTFVIEEKFGFNKTTKKTFILDKIKGWLLSAILGGGIMTLVIWFYTLTKDNFWLYAWILVSGFSIFMSMFYSNLIVPLFNKQTPLPESELRTEIEKLATEVGFQLKNIYQIDGSKRSTKANAYFTGLGAKKRIVLYDTLTNDLSNSEITAVLAHEIGHYKKHHTLWNMLFSIIQTGIILYIFSLLVDNPQLSKALGIEQPAFHIGLIAFGILFSPISMITGILMNIFSRYNEYQADQFAKTHHYGNELINALKKLSVSSLSNLTPHSLNIFIHYSHPTLLQRINAIQKN